MSDTPSPPASAELKVKVLSKIEIRNAIEAYLNGHNRDGRVGRKLDNG